MMDPRSAKVLQDIVRRESVSLLQYVREAFPWTELAQEDRLVKFQKLAEEDRTAIGELSQFLTRLHHPIHFVGSFPEMFTAINFVAFDHLLPKLLKGQMASLAYAEQKLQEMPACEGRESLAKLVQLKRHILRELEAISPSQPAAPSVAKAS